MAIEIKVPRLGWSMEEGTFVEWLKREGDQVRAGEPLFAIEGDKAIQEVESIGTGILRISPTAPRNGEVVAVGAVLAMLIGPGERIDFREATSAPSVESASGSEANEPRVAFAMNDAPAGNVSQLQPVRGTRISPRATRVAAELGVDCTQLRGTGPNGRIRERDVRAASSGQRAAIPSDRPPVGAPISPAIIATFPPLRKSIAARMVESARTTAPVTLTTTTDATNLVSLRRQFKAVAKSADEPVPGYTDIVIKLAARALQEHPDLNRQWIDGEIVIPNGIHIALAVDTPAGLVAPVVRDVLSLELPAIAARTSELKSRALGSRLTPDELRGGTFTISNLGAYGIDAFTPIINVPQCAVLGMGRIDRRPTVVADQIVPRDVITLSLTFDHRIVDGAPAARFLASLAKRIENPAASLIGPVARPE